MTIAYVYKWVEKTTMKWYIGSRTAKKCNPDDGYICSSKIVKPLIQENPENWVRYIIETGEPKNMLALEHDILYCANAAHDIRSYNQTNGGTEFGNGGKQLSEQHKMAISLGGLGKKRPPRTKEHSEKISASNIGKQVGALNKNYKGVAVGVNIKDGFTVMFKGEKEMIYAGFSPSAISACINGKRNKHKGYTWSRTS